MDLTNITQLLRQQIGLDHGTIGESSIEVAVRARMEAVRLADVATYVERLAANASELLALTEEVIVPETWFFRGFDQLRFLAEVGRQWQPAFPGQPLRVLSVPCSSGEEPYSTYMFLRHYGLEPSQIRIVAADISQRSLDRAARGIYADFSFRETEPLCELLRYRFFERDSVHTVIPEVRDAVLFRRDNLISPTFLADCGQFDLIVCRNLLIYFDPPSRQLALQSLQRLLAPNGYLFGGHAEQLALLDPRLKSVGPAGAFAYQRIEAAAVTNAQRSASWSERKSTVQIPPAQPAFVSAFAPEVSTALARPAVEPRPSGSGSSSFPTPLPNGRGSQLPVPTATRQEVAQDMLAGAERAANSGRLSDARAMCERHMEQHGPTSAALCLMGVIQQAAGELTNAEKSFQRAVYLDPAHQDSLWHLTLLAERRGDRQAVETFKRRLARVAASD